MALSGRPHNNLEAIFQDGLLNGTAMFSVPTTLKQDGSDYDASEVELVRAHRNVLSASSEYFRNMFRSGMKEAEEGYTIPIRNADAQAFRSLLRLIITGELCADLDCSTLLVMRNLVHFYSLDDLFHKIGDELVMKTGSSDSCWALLRLLYEPTSYPTARIINMDVIGIITLQLKACSSRDEFNSPQFLESPAQLIFDFLERTRSIGFSESELLQLLCDWAQAAAKRGEEVPGSESSQSSGQEQSKDDSYKSSSGPVAKKRRLDSGTESADSEMGEAVHKKAVLLLNFVLSAYPFLHTTSDDIVKHLLLPGWISDHYLSSLLASNMTGQTHREITALQVRSLDIRKPLTLTDVTSAGDEDDEDAACRLVRRVMPGHPHGISLAFSSLLSKSCNPGEPPPVRSIRCGQHTIPVFDLRASPGKLILQFSMFFKLRAEPSLVLSSIHKAAGAANRKEVRVQIFESQGGRTMWCNRHSDKRIDVTDRVLELSVVHVAPTIEDRAGFVSAALGFASGERSIAWYQLNDFCPYSQELHLTHHNSWPREGSLHPMCSSGTLEILHASYVIADAPPPPPPTPPPQPPAVAAAAVQQAAMGAVLAALAVDAAPVAANHDGDEGHAVQGLVAAAAQAVPAVDAAAAAGPEAGANPA